MRMSELVSNLTPVTYTVIGLVMFVAVFAVIVVRAWWPGTTAVHERIKCLPLEGDVS